MSSNPPDISGLWDFSYLNENCSNGTLSITMSSILGYFSGYFSYTKGTETLGGPITPPGSGIYDNMSVEYTVMWEDGRQVLEFRFNGKVNSDGTEITGQMSGWCAGDKTMTKATGE